ncbi:hypothetical protein IGI04_011040 [Brassica rapa subsp. trilocularis]|uniref:Uncharacterized protein n=1 Tax=Brassica rapa subsp. trilocularis TaxID=1813537 RepID=A0ABQ7N435_BRACM|nr:hypothetical protein IGI04_011040 [Brassica rapa subsp. trilocularis]
MSDMLEPCSQFGMVFRSGLLLVVQGVWGLCLCSPVAFRRNRVGVSGKVASFCCRFRFRSALLVQRGGESWQWCAGVFLFRLMAAGLEFSIWWWRRVKLSLGALGELVAARYNLYVCGCHMSPLCNSFSSGGSRWMSCLLVWLCGVAIRAVQALARSDQLRHSTAPLSSASSFDWDGSSFSNASV